MSEASSTAAAAAPFDGPPVVDVLVPVFNGARFVRASIDSILAQSVASLRVVVVDDGSTDETPAILADLARADARVRVVTRENGGIVEALNQGLALCTAPFVARHDADDLASPRRLAEQIRFLESNPAIDAVASAARFVDAEGHPTGETSTLADPDRADPLGVPAREPYLLHPFLLARRQALVAAGGYRHVLHAEDADLYWRMGEKGRLANVASVLGDYRQHGASVSSASVRNGRQLSVASQLCALSAARRRACRPDLTLDRSLSRRLRDASGSLAEACRAVSDELDPDERRHLRVAAAAKLLEQSGARPYELDTADCRFFADAWRESRDRINAADRAQLARNRSGAASRLAGAGRLRDAALLLTGDTVLPFAGKLAAKTLLRGRGYGTLRRGVHRARHLLRRP